MSGFEPITEALPETTTVEIKDVSEAVYSIDYDQSEYERLGADFDNIEGEAKTPELDPEQQQEQQQQDERLRQEHDANKRAMRTAMIMGAYSKIGQELQRRKGFSPLTPEQVMELTNKTLALEPFFPSLFAGSDIIPPKWLAVLALLYTGATIYGVKAAEVANTIEHPPQQQQAQPEGQPQ